MATLKRHLPWIQFLIVIGGLTLIYGRQIQSVEDMERRLTRCENDTNEITTSIGTIQGDIRVILNEIHNMRGSK